MRNLGAYWGCREESMQKWSKVDARFWWVQAPVDEVAQLKIGFAELRAFPIDHAGKISLMKQDIFWMKIVVEKLWPALIIQGRAVVLEELKCFSDNLETVWP